MFDELMLPDQAVLRRSGADRTRAVLPIRLPWYRSPVQEFIRGHRPRG